MPPSPDPSPRWTIIVPVKHTPLAKTRLRGLDQSFRQQLALAFACDTVTAARDCPWVRRVVVVTNDQQAAKELADLHAEVVPDRPDAGHNPALVHAAHVVRKSDPAANLAAMSGDLPALTPESLSAAFAAASAPYWFVSDTAGTGTTLLAAEAAHRLMPAFGPHSRTAHRQAGAVDLVADGLTRLRRDVDTEVDLREAARLGVGVHTSRVLARLGTHH